MSYDLVIRMKIDNASGLKERQRESETFYAKGLPWKLVTAVKQLPEFNYQDCLGLCLHCNWESESTDWICHFSQEFTIVNQDASQNTTSMTQAHCKFGLLPIAIFSEWSSLASKGYIENNTILIEARIRIKKVAGIRFPNPMDFTLPMDDISNVALLVDGRRLHVSKQILSVCSSVFKSMFFGGFNETGKDEVEIKDVDYDQFVDFLNVIHPTFTEILERTVPHILALADRFEVESVLEKAETYLIATNKFDTAAKLAFADQYRLNILMMRCLNSFKTVEELFALSNTIQYNGFSNETKSAICERFMELGNKKADAP